MSLYREKSHNFELKGIDNKFHSLSSCVGKNGTLIMFICNHCPYVKAIVKDLVKDVDILKAYCQDSEGTILKWW